jgi:hypothetical protein
MKNYVDLALKRGIHHALFELEADAISTFEGMTIAAAARGLKLSRTCLHWRVKKLNLSHLFTKEAKAKRMKGESENGVEKENQENYKEEI